MYLIILYDKHLYNGTFLWLSDLVAGTVTSDWSGNFSELSTFHFSLSSCSDSTKCANYSLSHQLLKPYCNIVLLVLYILELYWILIFYLSDLRSLCYLSYCFISLLLCSTCLLTGFSNISLNLWLVGLADQRYANPYLYTSPLLL